LVIRTQEPDDFRILQQLLDVSEGTRQIEHIVAVRLFRGLQVTLHDFHFVLHFGDILPRHALLLFLFLGLNELVFGRAQHQGFDVGFCVVPRTYHQLRYLDLPHPIDLPHHPYRLWRHELKKDGTRTAVQCKHWKTWNVGVRAVREFLGALTDAEIRRGIFITLAGYTGDAKQLADKHGIEVINEAGLARMLEAADARFDPAALEILRDTRKLCPKCECEMVLRTANRVRGAGNKFWGCSAFPRCQFTMPA
jgi:hypothetical protein